MKKLPRQIHLLAVELVPVVERAVGVPEVVVLGPGLGEVERRGLAAFGAEAGEAASEDGSVPEAPARAARIVGIRPPAVPLPPRRWRTRRATRPARRPPRPNRRRALPLRGSGPAGRRCRRPADSRRSRHRPGPGRRGCPRCSRGGAAPRPRHPRRRSPRCARRRRSRRCRRRRRPLARVRPRLPRRPEWRRLPSRSRRRRTPGARRGATPRRRRLPRPRPG